MKEYFNQDRSFCKNRECEQTDCIRHHSNIDWSVPPPWRSFVDFENTQHCPKNSKKK